MVGKRPLFKKVNIGGEALAKKNENLLTTMSKGGSPQKKNKAGKSRKTGKRRTKHGAKKNRRGQPKTCRERGCETGKKKRDYNFKGTVVEGREIPSIRGARQELLGEKTEAVTSTRSVMWHTLSKRQRVQKQDGT